MLSDVIHNLGVFILHVFQRKFIILRKYCFATCEYILTIFICFNFLSLCLLMTSVWLRIVGVCIIMMLS